MPNAPSADDRPRTPQERLNGVIWRLRATRRIWRRGARPEMPLLDPEPAPAVADGRLDVPAGGPVVGREVVTFRGWALLSSGPVSRVDLWLGDRPLGSARLGLPRPDVRRALGLAPGKTTGFELTVNLESWAGADGPADLHAVATGPAGERLELGPLPLSVAPAITSSRPSAPEITPLGCMGSGLRTLVVTHQLDLGGAQLYLMDLLRELLRIDAVDPTVVSAKDGCLREELEELGVPVHISGVPPTEELAAHLGRVEELAAWAADRDFEIAFVNTATSLVLPGVEVASRLGIPAVWAIHESFEPSVLWDGVDPAIRHRAEAALSEVAQPLFVAEATQRLFEPVTGRRGLTIPYGLDLEPIDRCRAGFDRDRARREAGIPLDADVVLCVGSIEPRKAQVPLTQAFDLLAARYPRARLVFVGGRDGPYNELLAEYADSRGAAERISIVPMTPDVQPWFGLCDLVVCPSDVESMPRVALEAMAWETPVLATNIFGLPELIEDGETGWLCEARDLAALTAALDRALASTPEERRRIGRAGRLLIEDRHSLEDYGREIADLLNRVVTGPLAAQVVDAAAR